MAAKIRLADGREVTVALSGKRVVDALSLIVKDGEAFARFVTPAKARVWVNPMHVAAIEDRPDLD
jgi:hypothetical protein